jgi:hypothetical protein
VPRPIARREAPRCFPQLGLLCICLGEAEPGHLFRGRLHPLIRQFVAALRKYVPLSNKSLLRVLDAMPPSESQGRNVILDQSYGAPRITKDGVSVAKEIEFKDRAINLGAQLVRSVASKTNDVAGDG